MSIMGGGGKSKTTQSEQFNQTSSTQMGGMGQSLLNNRMSELANNKYVELSSDDIQRYMNPYMQDVRDATVADIGAARDKERAAYEQRQLAAGPLGTSARQGVHEAEIAGQYDRTLATTLAGINSTGHNQAMTVAASENANKNNHSMSIQQMLNQLAGVLAGSDTITNSYGTSSAKGSQKGSNFGFGFKYGGGS